MSQLDEMSLSFYPVGMDIKTRSMGNTEQVVIWEAWVDLDRDEVNPDALHSTIGMLIESLSDIVETSAPQAADWETFLVHNIVLDSDDELRVSVSVRAL